MAKKTKRQTRKVSGVGTANSATESVIETGASVKTANRTYGSDFNPDYSQTIKDLRRIGILAGTFFAILVIISFFLR
jgi:hypothetical protein